MIKLTIFSLALLTVMAGAAVSPALGSIAANFPDVDKSLIKMILTVPSLCIIPVALISGRLTRIFTKRKVLLFGLLIYVIGGVGGGMVNNIYALLAFRAILGIGVGMIVPLSTSVVSDFYEGIERVRTMGQVTANNNLGGIISLVGSGLLASIGWRYSFGIYLLGIVSFFLVLIFFPSYTEPEEPKKSDGHFGGIFYFLALAMFFLMVLFYSVPTNMALYIQLKNIGESQITGVVMGTNTLTAFFAGIFFVQMRNLFKGITVAVMLFVMGGGILIMGLADSLAVLIAGNAFMGFGLGSLMPSIFMRVTKVVKPVQTVSAMAVISSMLYLGQFASPIILDNISVIFGDGSISFIYQFVGITMLLISIVFFCVLFSRYYAQGKKSYSNQ